MGMLPCRRCLATGLEMTDDANNFLNAPAPCCRPSKARPSRNEPALLPFVLRKVAEVRGQTMEHVAKTTTANACRLFGMNLD